MEKQQFKASVIIPVYNQKEALKYVLNFFNLQTCLMEDFEVVVVDDGSTDSIKEEALDYKYKFSLKIIHQDNKGRAAARNTGIRESSGEILIFCDADRVPDKDFISEHIDSHLKNELIATVGLSYDYFGGLSRLDAGNDTNEMLKYSRLPKYFKKISNLYKDCICSSPIAWITFLVGNSSVKRRHIEKVGCFNERFKHWGFEHFELANRLMDIGIVMYMNEKALNFHLPHKRDKNQILQNYISSCKIFEELHPEKRVGLLKDFMSGKISLQQFESSYTGKVYNTIPDEEIYFNL